MEQLETWSEHKFSLQSTGEQQNHPNFQLNDRWTIHTLYLDNLTGETEWQYSYGWCMEQLEPAQILPIQNTIVKNHPKFECVDGETI